MKSLRNDWKFSKLRYNDIPVTIPSPMSYPGRKPLDPCCPENVFLYKYLTNLFLGLPKYNSKLIAIFLTIQQVVKFMDILINVYHLKII